MTAQPPAAEPARTWRARDRLAEGHVVGVEAYVPASGGPDGFDADLAALAYGSVVGWHDQRPITPALVRSQLRPPPGARATLLATSRLPVDGRMRLVAAAALRWPQVPSEPGRLWGPVVHPGHRRRGLARAVLDALTDPAHLPAGVGLATAEIPARRQQALALFTTAGWVPHSRLTLLKARLPLPEPLPDPASGPRWNIRSARPGEDLSESLADLYAAANPDAATAEARNAWQRWRADARFHPACLALATLTPTPTDSAWQGHPERLAAAALVYPLAHTDPTEATEALLADLQIAPDIAPRAAGGTGSRRPDARWTGLVSYASTAMPALTTSAGAPRAGLRQQLVVHALNRAHHDHAAVIGRAIVLEADVTTRRCLNQVGFTTTSTMTTFRLPTTRRGTQWAR